MQQNHMRTFVLAGLICLASCLYAQDSITVRFVPRFGGESLALAQAYQTSEASMEFDALRFYISKVSLTQESKTTYQEPESYHLLDLTEPQSMAFRIPQTKASFDALTFYLGIDSATNVSGAMGGDLDPTKGMYWAWQSGYINFKLEGRSPQCPTRKNKFQYHLGGYRPPYATAREIQIPTTNRETITVFLDLDHFLAQLDLKEKHTVMSPGKAAKAFSTLLAQSFSGKE